MLAEQGAIDLAERRNRLLQRLAERWKNEPPPGFTVAAGITTAAPAVAALVARVARMPEGMVVLPGLWLSNIFPDEEWDALGPDEDGRGEADPSAIPSEAAARPARRCARRGAAVALVGRRRLVAGARPRGGQCHGGARFLAQMGDACGPPSGA